MFCRNCGAEMPNDGGFCAQCGAPAGSGVNHCPNCGAPLAPGTTFCANCGAQVMQPEQQQWQQGQPQMQQGMQWQQLEQVPMNERKSKLAAGLLGIFLGELGIHNFYLGRTGRAVVQLVVSVIGGMVSCGIATLAMWIWGLVEGIMILTGKINTDAKGIPLKE